MELDHIFHPDHKLTYKKTAGKDLVCAACVVEISGASSEHYRCVECKFFLHKLCAQRPTELTHFLHPEHPLLLLPKNPYPEKNDACHGCRDVMKGFVYRCTICDFHLDFICAFPDGWKLHHVCHPDHKLAYEDVVKKADKGVVCAACDDEISGEHYSCRPCNFFLDKVCAQRPSVLTHSSHPLHTLQLIPKKYFVKGYHLRCTACNKTLDGFVYDCTTCSFESIHFLCAFPNESDPELRHVCHKHKLTRESIVKRADKGVVCAACKEEVSGPLADYYSCRKCNFFLHQLCFQRPRQLTSPLHPHHQLDLLRKSPYKPGLAFCTSCQKSRKGFVYNCNRCIFNLDFKCVFPEAEKSIQSFDNVHDHPLMLLPRPAPAKFNCDLCSSSEGNGGDEEDESYVCSIPTCNFWVHKMCTFTALTQRYKGHNHQLSLIQGLPQDLQIYQGIYCDVCRKAIYPTDWVSYCARCTYFVHINCMMTDQTNLIKDAVDYLDDSFFKLILRDDKFKMVHWPASDVAKELIQAFLIGENSTGNVQPKVQHFSHEQHDMILFEELCVNNDSFFKEEDEEIMCDACIHPITAPYYCCQECNYYLHLACVNLPYRIKHFSHPDHELVLCFRKQIYNIYKCRRCGYYCNGFSYQCERCPGGFILDLTCAALPDVILHKTHEHLLFQMKSRDDGSCYGCSGTNKNGSLIFKCIYCDVYICYSCALYSGSIRHRWDRNHPIDLKFPPHDHPDKFMCDMCEEVIHPKYWLYSCFKCEVSMHLQCAPRYHLFPNIKFGGKVHTSSHPHVLTYLRKSTLKTTCDMCGRKLSDAFTVYECETCYDCFCYECVE